MDNIDERQLTTEEKEEMFGKVLDKVIEKRQGSEEGSFGEIDLDFLQKLTEPLPDEAYVSKSNDRLTEVYKGIVAMYGFEDYHSLYLFAKSITQRNEREDLQRPEEVEKKQRDGQKDFSKLSRVRRTVVRNGRPTKMTFYEDVKGIDNKLKGGTSSNRAEGNQTTNDAKELNIVAAGGFDDPITTEELLAARNISEGMTEILPDFDDVQRVKIYVDESIVPHAVHGLREEGEFITTSYLAYTQGTYGIYARAFYETIKVAMAYERGVIFAKDEIEVQQALAESVGLKEKEGTYQATYKQLVDSYNGTLP